METDFVEKETILNEQEIKNRLTNIDKTSRTKKSLSRSITKYLIFASPYLILVSVIIIASIITVILGFNEGQTMAQKLFNAMDIIFPFFLASFFIVPQIAIVLTTFITYKRTKYIGFFYEGLFGSILLVGVFLLIFLLHGQQSYVLLIQLACLSFILLPLISKLISKPLIHNSYQNINLEETSDIVVKQSLFINEFEDGYTTRQVFKDIREFIDKQGDFALIRNKVEKFAQFLSINGDLIGYDKNDNKLTMYLRTTLIQMFDLEDPFVLFKKIRQIIKKENLTSVTLDLNTWEMNFRLNKYDYDLYGNISYFQLSERILEQFSSALAEFIQDNYVKSYEIINPYSEFENIKIIKQTRWEKILLFYFVGIFIYLIYALWVYFNYPHGLLGSSVNSPYIVTLLFSWPILMVYYLFKNTLKFVIFISSNVILSFVLYHIFVRHSNKPKNIQKSKIKIVI